ncbi:MAG TPA: hypothetical protein VGK78_08435 [Nocardioides sp.]|uniref:hypothetical protein n=1 Tax=Nocardioides sp. TaxID=35761 RepID=UPI002F400D53
MSPRSTWTGRHDAGRLDFVYFPSRDAAESLRARGVEVGEPFEFPFGEGDEPDAPGPQRIAIYELTRADRGASLRGRRDF